MSSNDDHESHLSVLRNVDLRALDEAAAKAREQRAHETRARYESEAPARAARKTAAQRADEAARARLESLLAKDENKVSLAELLSAFEQTIGCTCCGGEPERAQEIVDVLRSRSSTLQAIAQQAAERLENAAQEQVFGSYTEKAEDQSDWVLAQQLREVVR